MTPTALTPVLDMLPRLPCPSTASRRTQGRHRRLAPLLLTASCAVLMGCTGTPHAAFATDEVELTRSAPGESAGPAPPAQAQHCPKDAPGCHAPAETSSRSEPRPLDPDARYDVTLSPRDPVRGPALAPVTLVVFSDFQCPFCKQLAFTLAQLQLRYSEQLRIVWKDLPLAHHEFALPAARLARSAYAEGGSRRFWELHDSIFVQQEHLNEATLKRLAQRFDLPWPPDPGTQGHIDDTFEQVLELNVRSTPTTFVNGRPVVGAKPLDAYVELIEDELARQP